MEAHKANNFKMVCVGSLPDWSSSMFEVHTMCGFQAHSKIVVGATKRTTRPQSTASSPNFNPKTRFFVLLTKITWSILTDMSAAP